MAVGREEPEVLDDGAGRVQHGGGDPGRVLPAPVFPPLRPPPDASFGGGHLGRRRQDRRHGSYGDRPASHGYDRC